MGNIEQLEERITQRLIRRKYNYVKLDVCYWLD